MWLAALLLGLSVISIESAGPKWRFSKDFTEIEPEYEFPHKFNNFDEPLSFRLPNTTIPLHYDLLLITDVHRGDFDFFGTVSVDFRVIIETYSVTMHYKQLNITKVDLYSSEGVLLQSNANFILVPEQEFIMISSWPDPLMVNRDYRVVITYRGVLRSDYEGFFRTSYVNEGGTRKWLASTQFQPTDARHAFPCYDEPQLRATFSLTIRHHGSYMALSNMPVESVTPGPIPGYVITKFEKTPSMQTYLVAFTVSDFHYAENALAHPPQRVYAKPASISMHEYELALEVSPDLLRACEEFFDFNYTLPKMDQIAFSSFAAGAMENWGLVSYLEPYLLFNSQTSTTRNHEYVLSTIAHEFVHQWTGNKVVFEWWTYLWLNEGFATLYEYYMVHIAYPNERFDDSFLIDVLQRVFEVDANPNIRPMSLYVDDPWDIYWLFDSVAYSKSGSVLHTFMHAFGASTWRRGLQRYILARYDNSANPRHLYEHLQSAVDEDFPTNTPNVRTTMESWEWQAGFPLVTVSLAGDQISLTQERFFYDPAASSESIWWIPINYVTASSPSSEDTSVDFWMSTQQMTVTNATAPKPWQQGDWVVFNIQQNFYYRVNYDRMLWTAIIEQLNSDFEAIHVRNRAQLIDDSYNLARSTHIDYAITFAVMDYLRFETDYVPWVPANRAMNVLNRYLSGSSVYDLYLAFMRSNTALLFNTLGVDFIAGEHRVDRFSRAIAINQACRAQLPECLTLSSAKLARHLRENERIEPDYITAIYCNGIRTANGILFGAMQNKLLQSSLQSERNNIITGMGCSQSTELLFMFLNLALMPGTQFTTAEKQRILTAPAPNGPLSLFAMIEFVSENFMAIQQISANAITSMLSNIATNVASEDVFDEFFALLEMLTDNQIITLVQFNTYRTNARANLNWQEANLQSIAEFLGSWQRRNFNAIQ